MITLRMVAIAAAILVSIPLALVLADGPIIIPGGEVVVVATEAAAEITDVVLADPPQFYERNATHNWPEQLVEGHTVFASLDIPLIPNVTNHTVDIVGNVECKHHFNASGPYFLGVPVYNRINRASVECRAGEQVFVTPDPWYDSSNTAFASRMEPTGRYLSFRAPNGFEGVATEYSYFVVTEDWMGEQRSSERFAWSVPIIEEWTHTDGRPKSWYCPIPVDRLHEMALTDFVVYTEDDLAKHGVLPEQ